jgi:hypothetical protein
MSRAHDYRIVATVEKSDGHEVRHTEIRRSIFEPGLVDDLDRFWSLTRRLAGFAGEGAIARLQLYREGRERPVCMRDPPFDASELPDRDRAASVLEALRKLTHD